MNYSLNQSLRILKRHNLKYFIIIIAILFLYSCNSITSLKENEYDELIKKYSSENDLDFYLVKAIIKVESNFNPDAISKVNAKGLMQLLPSTYIWISNNETDDDIFDPDINIHYGCKYLKYLFSKFKEIETVLAAYNAGEGNVSEWLKSTEYSKDGIILNSIPFNETKIYIYKVLEYFDSYKNKN